MRDLPLDVRITKDDVDVPPSVTFIGYESPRDGRKIMAERSFPAIEKIVSI